MKSQHARMRVRVGFTCVHHSSHRSTLIQAHKHFNTHARTCICKRKYGNYNEFTHEQIYTCTHMPTLPLRGVHVRVLAHTARTPVCTHFPLDIGWNAHIYAQTKIYTHAVCAFKRTQHIPLFAHIHSSTQDAKGSSQLRPLHLRLHPTAQALLPLPYVHCKRGTHHESSKPFLLIQNVIAVVSSTFTLAKCNTSIASHPVCPPLK